ncbi:MAG: glycosyltransferase [Desulfatiglans sp.]|nr:glycosyltransferase [Desulfatiglans sp.]
MTSAMRFSTALRQHVRNKIEQMDHADIVVGVPSFSSAQSIENVLKMIFKGIKRHYPDHRAFIVVSDGGSTDDTREVARLVDPKSYNIDSIVTIYRGLPGKGSGLRAVLEIAAFLKARAVAFFDSDLMSITPEWIKSLIDPVMDGYDFVAPDYNRYKLDGTITNTIAYNLTRALYGQKIRQPIGGDFGVSPALVRYYLNQDVWETDVAKFGIDIWMTTSAIVGGFRICQAKLGAKVHGHKDPTADLGPMFRQVVGTTFQLMTQYQEYWMNVKGSKDVPSIGEAAGQEAEPFEIDHLSLIEYFKVGMKNFSGVWQNIIEENDMKSINDLAIVDKPDQFNLPIETWVKIVYQYAGTFHASPRQRFKVLDTMIPLYYARIASLVNELKDKNAKEAEDHFEAQAKCFEDLKGYMIEIWNRKGGA